jgi:hypothetical protein
MPTPSRPPTIPHATNTRAAAATAILVLGMHRSGTSAVTRVLNLRGAELGRDLLPPKQDNERGFWENRAILEQHETLLAGLGLRWLDLVDLPEGWQRSAPARRFVAELPAVLKQQFDGSRLVTVKDPRLSLLAPLWIEALAATGVRPTFVITIRHPHEVAASLERRDGLTRAQSQLLWLQHLVDAERATRGQPRVFVHYERLLADWRTELQRIGAQLAIDWPTAPAVFDAAVTQFLAPALRHHRANDAANPPLLPIVEQAYAEASAAAQGPAPAALFDQLGRGFEALIGTVAPLYRELAARHDAGHDAHLREIERARAAFATKEVEIAQARAAFATKEDEIARARAAFATKEDEIAQARAAFATKEDEIAQAREAAAIRQADLDAARQTIDALSAELGNARGLIDGKDQEIAAARINVDTLTTELALARDNIHALAGEITVAREAHAVKEREIDAARANIDALGADLERAREAHALKDSKIEAQRSDAELQRKALAAKDQEIDAARASIDSLTGDIARAREGFAAKDAEIDAARRNIDNLAAQIDAARHAHGLRDATEASLRGELQALRNSRWFRLGRSLRLIGRDA